MNSITFRASTALFLVFWWTPLASSQSAMAELVDSVHQKAQAAEDAARLILTTDQYRREADRLLAAGDIHESRARLRLAEEMIAAAISDDGSLVSNPLLRDYLTQWRTAAFPEEPRKTNSDLLSPGPLEHVNAAYPFIREVLSRHGLPVQLAAVAVVESDGNASARSPKGALGLWQLMPDTARRYGLRVDPVVDDRLDPIKSTYAAARYLRNLYQLFGDWPLTLAAYNAGEHRILKLIQKTSIPEFLELARRHMLPAETARYVPAVLSLMLY